MSVDIHFAAYVSVSEIASSGSPRDARNPFTSATRPASEASSEAASAWPAGITKPLPMAAIARIVLTNLRKAHLPRVSGDRPRSEEHTSELQSRLHIVCRLLLEKKKRNKYRQLHRQVTVPHLSKHAEKP